MTRSLLAQIGLSTGMVVLSVLIHLIGLSLLIALMSRHARRLETRKTRLLQAFVLVGAAFGLFALHTVEIWAYALLYFALGATGSFEDALYFSTVTYATIGYGDLTLSPLSPARAPQREAFFAALGAAVTDPAKRARLLADLARLA